MKQENEKIEKEALFRLSYGLYLLTTRTGEGGFNGCIINTVMQVTDTDPHILFAVNDEHYTAECLRVGAEVTVSVLENSAPFSLYEHFGYQSGRDTDKFAGRDDPLAANGLPYLKEGAVAMIAATVETAIPCGTHTVYLARVTECRTLSEGKPVTYAEYFTNIKPSKVETESRKKGYVCTVCGYVYEGEELPEDYVCPVCHVGRDQFEKLP